ncbi:MAG: hypothetical protein V7K53_24635 [Nostoc sp.]|uniref:hypothetical protein n=1 Tax=Nostoc sp. TaxID=1180 RepID=UPI002FFC126A
MSIEQHTFFFNGINGETGEYSQPLKLEQIMAQAQGEKEDYLKELETKYQNKGKDYFRLIEGVNPQDLAEAGWGVIFANDDPMKEAVREKLESLLKYRQEQAKSRYKEYKYIRGDSKNKFLTRHDVGDSNLVDPSKVPYYLLIIGDPETIPYEFQYQLDVAYAVGRIYFENLEDYERYASNVVDIENGKVSLPRRAVFFGVHNEGDDATEWSHEHLISPLSEWIEEEIKIKGWEVQTLVKDQAKKEQLKQLIEGSKTPGFLFTASHGVFFPQDSELQLKHQGALLCQDWRGGETFTKDYYFSADDISNEAQLHGLITFHFACHSIGTPELDSFDNSSNRLAPKPFVARLPQRLLSQGALAVIGHVDRVLKYSFLGSYGQAQLETFKDSLIRLLMKGYPVGYAVESFNERYSALAADLLASRTDSSVSDWHVSDLWLAYRDARSYAILGDPAVRLVVGDAQQCEQTTKETVHLSPTPSILKLSTDERAAVTSQTAERVDEEVDLAQAQNQLNQALEQFVNIAQQVPAHQAEQLQLAVEAAINRLNEVATNLKIKQAQNQLSQVLEQFVNIVQQSSTYQADQFQLTVKLATDLLESLKKLS